MTLRKAELDRKAERGVGQAVREVRAGREVRARGVALEAVVHRQGQEDWMFSAIQLPANVKTWATKGNSSLVAAKTISDGGARRSNRNGTYVPKTAT